MVGRGVVGFERGQIDAWSRVEDLRRPWLARPTPRRVVGAPRAIEAINQHHIARIVRRHRLSPANPRTPQESLSKGPRSRTPCIAAVTASEHPGSAADALKGRPVGIEVPDSTLAHVEQGEGPRRSSRNDCPTSYVTLMTTPNGRRGTPG